VRRTALFLHVFVLLMASSGLSQEAQIQIAPGPHYVGESIRILVSVKGFDEEPTPELELPESPSGVLRLAGASPNVNQSISIRGGKVTRTREVTHVFDLRFEPRAAGRSSIGPLRIVQAGREVVVRPIAVNIETLSTRDDFAVEVLLPDRPIYVGERAPVTVRLRLASRLQRDMENYTLRVPLFDDEVPFQFLDSEEEADTQLVVTTAAGQLPLRGHVRQTAGEVIIEATRTLVPLAAGRHELAPASLVVSEGVAFQRDLFGGRRATRVRKWRTESPPLSLEVRHIPDAGRPASFAGTVGRGFTLSVSADRSVVRAGDPITLTLLLRGEGLETAALPPLSAEGLLPESDFRVPAGVPVGELDGEVKRWTAVVRVADEAVAGIPELEFSWFDPETERFETTRSRPIALSVSEGRIVGAGDVARGELPEPELPASPRPEIPTLSTTTADLAIEQARERLLRDAGGGLASLGVQGACYAGGLLLVALALRSRRRGDEDPAVRRQREKLTELLSRIDASQGLPPEGALDALADALRRIRAEAPGADGREIDALVGECEALRYAPERSSLDTELVERARAAAGRFVAGLQ